MKEERDLDKNKTKANNLIERQAKQQFSYRVETFYINLKVTSDLIPKYSTFKYIQLFIH